MLPNTHNCASHEPSAPASPSPAHLPARLQAVAGQPGVSGFVVAGLGTGESREQRQQIVQAVLQRLPAGAPRMLSSVGTPEEVLEAVAQVCEGWGLVLGMGLGKGGGAAVQLTRRLWGGREYALKPRSLLSVASHLAHHEMHCTFRCISLAGHRPV